MRKQVPSESQWFKCLPYLTALMAGAVFAVSCPAANTTAFEDPCVTFLQGRFSEFLSDTNGAIILFASDYNGVTRVWHDGQWHENAALTTVGTVRDAVQPDPGRWLLVSQVSDAEVFLYEFSESRLRFVGRLSGHFQRATLHLAADGSVWVTSAEGVAYGLKDGKAITHKFGAEVEKTRGFYSYYSPAISLDVPNCGLWFWSHVQHEALDFGVGPEPNIEGFHVYQDGEWRVVPHGGGKLGGAVLRDADTIIAGSRNKGMFSLHVDNGEVREFESRLPPDEHCIFLHRAPAGRLLLITARPLMSMRLAPVHGGRLGQLLAWKDGEIKTLLNGVDFKSIFSDKGRSVADVKEGTFLSEAQSGLLFVSSDLHTVKRLDWRYGVTLPNIDRMRRRDEQLCVLDRERGFAILDYPTLLRTSENTSCRNWSVFASASPPTVASDGSVWHITASEPPELSHWVGTNEIRVSMEGGEFPAKSRCYLTTDTKDRLWLIGYHGTRRTAFLSGERWRTFDLRETAYSTVALDEAGNAEYRLGSPSDHYYPAFAGDGRVAYQNEWGRICVFDGKKWDAGHGEGKIDGRSPEGQPFFKWNTGHGEGIIEGRLLEGLPEGPPFYRKGVLTVRAGDSYYEYLNGQWRLTHADVKSPYGDNPRRNNVGDIPKSFPGDAARCSIRIRDNQDTLWIGSPDELWRGLNDVWVPFAVRESPLCLASEVTRIQVDGSGYIWFALSGGAYTRLARYQPRGSPPKVEWSETPAAEITTSSFACDIRITGADASCVVRRQVDNGEWRQEFTSKPLYVVYFEGLPNGIHTIRVQVFDELLRASRVLERRVTVNRDYQKEIAQLSSDDFLERERAATALVNIGKPALPALRVLEAEADAGEQWWIRAIREEIERQR